MSRQRRSRMSQLVTENLLSRANRGRHCDRRSQNLHAAEMNPAERHLSTDSSDSQNGEMAGPAVPRIDAQLYSFEPCEQHSVAVLSSAFFGYSSRRRGHFG